MAPATDAQHAYLQVADAFRDLIARGELAPGQRLPSIRQIASDHNIAAATAQNALAVLKDDGLIKATSTRGYFVTEDAAALILGGGNTGAIEQRIAALATELERLKERVVRLEEER